MKPKAEERFRLLYDDHAALVARYVARRISVDDVQDVVSETFLIAWRRLDDMPDDSVPWLLATARNVIANKQRSRRRQRELGIRLAALPRWPTTTAVEDSAIDQRLVEAIKGLPSNEREAVMLVAWDGLDMERAAQAAGCGRSAFRMRLHRARRRLSKQLGPRPLVLVEEQQ